MKLTDSEKKEILRMRNDGYSSRQIASKLLGRESRKTTVTDYLSRYPVLDESEKDSPNNGAKILIVDIETSPTLSYVWGRWKQNISQTQVLSESFILTYSAKWLGDENIFVGFLDSKSIKEENDHQLLVELHDLLNEADIVIAHNAMGFDVKVMNTRFIAHGFLPPSYYKVIDTLRIAKAQFRFPSNKLDSICHYLNIDGKIETGGFKLWRDVLFGDEEALARMVDYNINDVLILENVYLKMRPWHTTHPNLQVYRKNIDDLICTCCGSSDIIKTDDIYFTNVSGFELMRCKSCGKRFRGRKNIMERDQIYVGV